MKGKKLVNNPFQVGYSPRIDSEVTRLKDVRTKRVFESATLLEGSETMINGLIEMAELLSVCVISGDEAKMERCAQLARSIHTEQKTLTDYLVASGMSGTMMKGVLRVPYRLDRVGDMLEDILQYCRIKASEEVPFSPQAQDELSRLFTRLVEILTGLRCGLETPEGDLLSEVIADVDLLMARVDAFRDAHWERLEAGICTAAASSMYRKILDAVKWAAEYARKVCQSIQETTAAH